MADSNKIIRLHAVAKEFNVGISTIVEFLNKKGLQLDSNPNNKIPLEYYEMLQKEYNSDLKSKRETERIDFHKVREKKETVSLDNLRNKHKQDETKQETADILIKDVSGRKVLVPPQKEENPEKKEGVKILGKIDLNAFNKSRYSQEKNDSSKKEENSRSEKDSQNNNSNQNNNNNRRGRGRNRRRGGGSGRYNDNNNSSNQNQGNRNDGQNNNNSSYNNSRNNSFRSNNFSQKDKNVKQEQKTVDKKTLEEQISNLDTPIYITANTLNKEKSDGPELKVVGKIDLDALNQRTRPPKKTRKEREDERKAKERTIRENQAKERKQLEKEKKDDISKSISKIREKEGDENKVNKERDSHQQQQQRPFNKNRNFNDQTSRRNDQRNKPPERVQVRTTSTSTTNNSNKPATKVTSFAERNKLQQQQQQNKNASLKKKKRVKIEINDDDIQKQVKETLARLTSKPKSKSSKYKREKRDEIRTRMQEEMAKLEQDKNILKVTEFISANELSTMMNIPVNKVIEACLSLDVKVSINQRLGAETISLIADEFGYKVEFISVEGQQTLEEEIDNLQDLKPRAPIVTVMGHVDHGKTSLLDYIRKTNVIAGEAGGITQHIGAYHVSLGDGKNITFLDTPGHEAFTAMRARGAKVTDIAIIVIAADDNVMPQTVEAIHHAQAAGVPIVFAINKIDKPAALPEKIKEQLAKMNLLVEDWGGKYQSQEIAAKKGINVEKLLEKVLFEAELLDLKANPNRRPKGTVIVSTLDKGKGYVATILIQTGTLHQGDIILAGSHYGKVKAMYNERGQKIKVAGPSEPVQVLGLNGAPQDGDIFTVLESEKDAKEIATKREQIQREMDIRTQKHITLEEIGRRRKIENFKELNIIAKGDVDGTVEAISDALLKLSTTQIQVRIIHKAVGQISESDVMLAAASNAIIVGFQVRPSLNAKKLAEKEGIDIRLYSIIYDAIEEITQAIEGMLAPEIKQETLGAAEVRSVFKITKVGTIAGCMIVDGKITRSSRVHLVRNGIVVYTGEILSLKRFKDDIKEVQKGMDCGIGIKNFNDIKEGDIIEAFQETEIKKKL